jgi:Zn-dependent protease with chaperone function
VHGIGVEQGATLTLLYAGSVTVCAPVLLKRGDWWMARPRLALASWWGAFLSGVVATAAAVVLAILLLERHRTHPSHDVASSIGFEIATWLLVLLLAGGLALTAGRAELVVLRGRDRRRDLATMASTRGVRTESRDRFDLVVLDTEIDLACSLSGRRPRVLISEGLLARLSVAELEAVLCHEEAHLRGRHHQLARLAEIGAACFPWLPASRDLRQLTALLVELAADDHARRRMGTEVTAAALTKLSAVSARATLELRAERVVQVR